MSRAVFSKTATGHVGQQARAFAQCSTHVDDRQQVVSAFRSNARSARNVVFCGLSRSAIRSTRFANLANELHVDLVVVGHRCRTGLSRWWMGAGNTPLLDRVSCSILVACSSAQEQQQAAA